MSEVISRHRLWGFAYYARSEAYRDKFQCTRDLADLRAAMEDSQIARWLLPNSNTIKSSALQLYLDAYRFAQASPDRVNDVQRDEWRSNAEVLAAEFAKSAFLLGGLGRCPRLLSSDRANEGGRCD